MRENVYATFGQELYARETVRAAELIANASGELFGELNYAAAVADALPHSSASTRARLAAKLVQRLSSASGFADCPRDFARLLTGLSDFQARRELVFYSVARADRIVGAIAREVLYPYFIEERLPRGVGETEFALHNTWRLLMVEPLVTIPFIAWYAERYWDFVSARTVVLALRIFRQAGILNVSPLSGEERRTHACTLAPHGLSLAAFVWCLYDEFADAPMPPSPDRVERADFAQIFVVPPTIISERLIEAEAAGYISWSYSGESKRMELTLKREELVSRLLGG
jgi:hypothetical protein